MTEQPQSRRAPLRAWQTMLLRLTAFPSPAAQITDANWWQDVVGQPPETRISSPRSGELREEGPFDTGVLTLTIQPLRIDWNYRISEQEELQGEGLPAIGTFPEALERFLEVMTKWLTNYSPELQRLAFGTVLLLRANDRGDAYEKLSDYLPDIKLDVDNSSDFFYQINRPRILTKGNTDIQINRLSKWSALALTRALLQLNPQNISSGPIPLSEVHACRLELDINTSADYTGQFASQILPEIFMALIDLGKEIAERGDIK